MATKNLRVLVAEDSQINTTGSFQNALQAVEPGLDLTMVTSVTTLLPSIKLVDPEIIFLDISLAQPEPTEVVRRLHRATPGVPIIVLVDVDSKEYAARCISEGAMDYLSKEMMDAENVNRVLRLALERNTLTGLTDLLRDSQTTFHNRDAFLALGAKTMETGRRNAGSLVLLCAQLSNFAAMRAEFGPAAADEAILEIAEVLTKSFRQTDTLARIGDAQFAALAADAVEPSVEILRQRIEKRLTAYNQSRRHNGALDLRISARFWSGREGGTFSDFLDRVESGLRQEPLELQKKEAIAMEAAQS